MSQEPTSQAALLDRIIAFRLGRWATDAYGCTPASAHEHLSRLETRSLFSYDADTGKPDELNGWNRRLKRNAKGIWELTNLKLPSDGRVANFLVHVDSVGCRGRLMGNFQDAAYWDYETELNGLSYPVFQFARRSYQTGVVLWPLGFDFMGPGSPNLPRLLGEKDMPFEDKRDMVVWRGRLSGTTFDGRRISYAESVSGIARTEVSEKAFLAHCENHPRLRFALRYAGAPDVDIGITGPPPFGAESAEADPAADTSPVRKAVRRMSGGRLSREGQLGYRYIVAIEGNDYATSMYWVLSSNSALLMPVPKWKTLLDYGLRPWEHYVPLSDDFLDFPQKLRWCREHPEEVKAMIARAKTYYATLVDVELRDLADEAVIARVDGICRRSDKRRPLSYATTRWLSKPHRHKPAG